MSARPRHIFRIKDRAPAHLVGLLVYLEGPPEYLIVGKVPTQNLAGPLTTYLAGPLYISKSFPFTSDRFLCISGGSPCISGKSPCISGASPSPCISGRSPCIFVMFLCISCSSPFISGGSPYMFRRSLCLVDALAYLAVPLAYLVGPFEYLPGNLTYLAGPLTCLAIPLHI